MYIVYDMCWSFSGCSETLFYYFYGSHTVWCSAKSKTHSTLTDIPITFFYILEQFCRRNPRKYEWTTGSYGSEHVGFTMCVLVINLTVFWWSGRPLCDHFAPLYMRILSILKPKLEIATYCMGDPFVFCNQQSVVSLFMLWFIRMPKPKGTILDSV